MLTHRLQFQIPAIEGNIERALAKMATVSFGRAINANFSLFTSVMWRPKYTVSACDYICLRCEQIILLLIGHERFYRMFSRCRNVQYLNVGFRSGPSVSVARPVTSL